MTEQQQTFHSLRRQSPKGVRDPLNYCVLCGQRDLKIEQLWEPCPNQRGLTNNEAVLEAITGEAPDA